MARLYKWLCVEAIPAKDGPGVMWLVTDSHGNYAGVDATRSQEPGLDAVERYTPRKRVRRESVELTRAIARGMLKAHLPKGAKKGSKPYAVAATIGEAFKKFGILAEPESPKVVKTKKAGS